jgi:uncharacterized protein YdhG (YjbR/CyaY superfamily)
LNSKPKTIDEYLAGASVEQRSVLQKLRQAIHSVAPKAEECISYGLPAFRLNGRTLVAFGAWKEHCAFYPMSGATLKNFQTELEDFPTSKGTVRFSCEKPLPIALAKKLVRARIQEQKKKVTNPLK